MLSRLLATYGRLLIGEQAHVGVSHLLFGKAFDDVRTKP